MFVSELTWCSYILTVPVDRALVSHSMSLSLKGRSTRLTPWSTSTALSGYNKWCVVRFPTSFSNPRVTALFILKNSEIIQRWRLLKDTFTDTTTTLHTGTQSGGSRLICHFLTVAICQSFQPLHKYGKGMEVAWSPQWVREWLWTSLPPLPLESCRYQIAEDAV